MENTATPSTNSQACPVEENYSWRDLNVEQPRENYDLPPPPVYEENIHQPEYTTQMFPYINEQQTGQTIVLIQPQAGDANYVDPCLTLSIISCLCCFCPTGIVAIVMSCLADSSMDSGDYEQAKTYSKWAKYFGVASITIGATILAITIIGLLFG